MLKTLRKSVREAMKITCSIASPQFAISASTTRAQVCPSFNRRAGMRHELKFPLGSMQGLRNTAFKKGGYLSEI